MRERFKTTNFQAATLAVIDQANEIIEDYQAQGFRLTLRQLYYQFVAMDLLPNKQKEYDRLGSIINDARIAGLIDWDAIEDRTRNLRSPSAWGTAQEIMDSAAESYRENPWLKQRYRPEVWVEKDAIVGVVEPACNRFRVPFFACRGYTSQSEAYSAGKRFAEYISEGYLPIVFHLGDHDPSGIDMTRDNGKRLDMFAEDQVEMRRIALNWDQVQQYNPPPNPAKKNDSRYEDYRRKFGEESWELDSLKPGVIDALIERHVRTLIDHVAWDESMTNERENRAMLKAATNRWAEVEKFLAGEE